MSQRRDAVRTDPADLLAQIARGDREALRSLHGRLASRLFGLAVAMLRDRTVAADVLQQSFVDLWHNARHFDPAASTVEAWTVASLRRAALATARTRGRERPLDEAKFGEVAIDPDGLADLTGNAEAQRLNADLARLAGFERRAVVLAYVHGLSIPELAGRLDVPSDRALAVLRAGLAGLSIAASPRDALAGEHVVGVLDAHGAAEVEVLQMADPAWRAAVAGWERCLAPLALLARPETPPGNIWERIAARASPAEPPRLRQRRRAGRLVLGWAILANLAAAGLAGYLFFPRPQPPRLMAMLGNDRNLPGVVLEAERNGKLRITTLNAVSGRALQAPGGRAFQLWAVLPGRPAPVSVAVLPHEMPRQMSVSAPPGTVVAETVFQISIEAEGGSRTKAPAGTVIYIGRLAPTAAPEIDPP